MKIALPVYEERVAPRFDCATSFRIITCEKGKITKSENVIFASSKPLERMNMILNLGIKTLICGAVNEFALRMFKEKGINVIPWIIGNVQEVIDSFLKGDLKPGYTFSPDGKRFCCRMRFGKKRDRNYINKSKGGEKNARL